MSRAACPCGTLRPSVGHGKVPARWSDRRDGATVRVEGTAERLRCTGCGRTRTVRPPGLHPTRDMTTSLVEAVVGDAARGSCLGSARTHGVHRLTVAALVEEAVADLSSGDLPDGVAVFAPKGAGGALAVVGLADGTLLDAFSGSGDARIAPFLARSPEPALHCDWSAACAFRPHASAEGRVSMPAAARTAWLATTLPVCDAAFVAGRAGRSRWVAGRLRAAVALGTRHPLSLSIPDAASLRAARAADADLRAYLDARRSLVRLMAVHDGDEARAAYGRWAASVAPGIIGCFRLPRVRLARMSDVAFGDGDVDPDAWSAATALSPPGLQPGNARLALLRGLLGGHVVAR